MVDPVGSYSQIQKITSSAPKIQKDVESEKTASSTPVDEVSISDDAAILALASDSAALISGYNNVVLSSSREQLDELA